MHSGLDIESKITVMCTELLSRVKACIADIHNLYMDALPALQSKCAVLLQDTAEKE